MNHLLEATQLRTFQNAGHFEDFHYDPFLGKWFEKRKEKRSTNEKVIARKQKRENRKLERSEKEIGTPKKRPLFRGEDIPRLKTRPVEKIPTTEKPRDPIGLAEQQQPTEEFVREAENQNDKKENSSAFPIKSIGIGLGILALGIGAIYVLRSSAPMPIPSTK